jgi:hypothetical protein
MDEPGGLEENLQTAIELECLAVTSPTSSFDTLINEKAREQALASERNVIPLVFLSYSHRDNNEKEALCTHLLGLEVPLEQSIGIRRSDFIVDWSDEKIGAGAKWKEEILDVLREAKVALLLITADFLKSAFIRDEELPAILQRMHSEGLAVYPVYAKDCAVEVHKWLMDMQIRPRGLKAVWRRGGSPARELKGIAREVFDILRKVLPPRAVSEEIPSSQKAVLERTRELTVAAQKAEAE